MVFTAACIDTALTFQAQKRVFIRDRYAGLFYYCMCALILIYVGGYEIGVKRGYLAFQTLSGSVRGSMRAPHADERISPENLKYCLQSGDHPWDELPFARGMCIDSGKDVTHFSREESSALLVGTRVTAKPQARNNACENTWKSAHVNHNCSPWITTEASDWDTYLIADIESSVILIQHTASVKTSSERLGTSVSSFGLDRPNATLYGASATISTQKLVGGDQVTIGALLDAAGVSLDAAHNSDQLNQGHGVYDGTMTTLRSQGLSLVVDVEYDPLEVGKYAYHVRVADIEGKHEYEDWDHVENSSVPQRVLVDLHGIQIYFHQSGKEACGSPRTRPLPHVLLNAWKLLASCLGLPRLFVSSSER